MRRWLLPTALLVLALVAGALAWRAEAAEPAPSGEVASSSSSTPSTPVLSVRRAPLWLQRPGGAERLELAVEPFLDQSPQPACLVVESGGRRIVELAADEPLVPASNQKLLVAAAVLDVLGPDATFTTTAAASAPPDDEGTLEGDLWLLGGGDPALVTEDYLQGFEEEPVHTSLEVLADAVVEAGVSRITGGVRGDDTRYDNVRTVETWPTRGLTRSRPGALSALGVNDGFASYPTDPDSDATPQLAEDPPLQAATTFSELLSERGVEVAGAAAADVAPDDLLSLATVDSPPLREVVSRLLGASDNTTAELLVKELGLQRRGEGSTEAGLEALREVLEGLGLPLEGVVLADGSGLHDQNRLTCELILEVLQRAGPTSPLAEGLPVAGESGTLRQRFLDTFVVGRVRAKTGFLNEATALSGFVETVTGVDVVFAHVANGEVGEADIALQDMLANALVRYPEAPTLEELGPLPAGGS